MNVLIKMIAVVMLSLPYAPLPAMQTQTTQDPEAVGKEVVTQLAARDFNDVESRFDDRMKSGLPQDKLSAVWDSIVGKVGPFHRIVHAEVVGQQSPQMVVVTCEFQHAALDAKIAVNAQGKVVGLFFAPSASQPGQAAWSAPSYANPAAFHERDVTVADGQWKLPGTLTLPKGNGPFAAVVLVHGSGPGDQDETIGPNKPFKDLAWGLASQNIAVLRYVKRTKQYGAQSVSGRGFTVKDETMDDADAAVSLLAAMPEIDHRHIYVLGHSLGGMLAPRIAAGDKQVAGIVIAAGTARPLQQVVVEQLKYISKLRGKPTEEEKKRIDAAERAEAEIDSPSLKPDSLVNFAGAEIPASYFLDLRNYHPAEVAAGLKIPILVLQGGRDYQVTRQDYDMWKAALSNDPRASFKFYPTLTHLFIAGTDAGPASPADYGVAGHVARGVIQDTAQWVNGNSTGK